MNDKIHKALTDEGPCLVPEELMAYHEGSLQGEQLRKVELHLAHCDLCSEAYDGLLLLGLSTDEIASDVAEINDRAWARVEQLSKPKKNRRPLIWLSAASVVLVATVGTWLGLSISQDKKLNQAFAEQFTMPPVDSSLLAAADLVVDDSLQNLAYADEEQLSTLSGEASTQKPALEAKNYANEQFAAPAPQEALTKSVDAATFDDYDGVAADAELEEVAEEEKLSQFLEDAPTPASVQPATTAGAGTKQPSNAVGEAKAPKKSDRDRKPASSKSAPQSNADMSVAATPAQERDDYARAENTMADSVSTYMYVPPPPGLVLGLGAYQAKDYRSAVSQFDEVLKVDPNHQEANFYAGVSYLSLEEANKAIQCLEKAKKGANGTIAENAEWYLALAYLKAKNKAKAEPLLKELQSRPASPYQQKATEVLDDIRTP
jgi:tetratricopeptide (TPR) repeat protein